MALKIRLARHGAKKRPYYRVVVADSRAPRDGRFIEIVGKYNPMLPKSSEDRVVLDIEKCKEWLNKGARPTERVARFRSESEVSSCLTQFYTKPLLQTRLTQWLQNSQNQYPQL